MTPAELSVAVIGGGPAGLMAAETLRAGGVQVDLYDSMPSPGRKFLLAGKGGMNLTHAEPFEQFRTRYGTRQDRIEPLLHVFGPEQLRAWARGLGIETFVGSSGRVFPTDMKAAPLLRAWLHRLRQAGVRLHMRHRWRGWAESGALAFDAPQGACEIRADAVVLALGGGSWPRLGSDGAWAPLLAARGVEIACLRPANCGFDVGWSEHFSSRFAGQPVKSVRLTLCEGAHRPAARSGEFVVTATGVEGSAIYALSSVLRDQIELSGSARIELDLLPDWSPQRVAAEVAHPRGSRSLSTHLRSRLGLSSVKAGLLRELLPPAEFADLPRLAARIKALPLRLIAPRPLEEAISSAGGVRFEALDENLMIKALPGIFCSGEMLDWEAPTGGYLLTACFAGGRAAGLGALSWLRESGTAGAHGSHTSARKCD